jgi:hypothetical protein
VDEIDDSYILSSANTIISDPKPELLLLDITPPNHAAYFERLQNYSSSYKNKQGIFLRSMYEIKNIGNTDLIVYQLLFDGDTCFSQGMRAAFCRPFTVAPYATALLDIR